MATTASNFVLCTGTALLGSAVTAAPFVQAVNGPSAFTLSTGTGAETVLDKVAVDLSTAAYAKNACAYLTLSGSTAITLDLTNLVAATGVVVAGDTLFATINQIVLKNTGAQDLTLAPGGANPFAAFLAGTTPTLTIPANSTMTLAKAAGQTVDGTHKTIVITPTAGGTIGISFGGA